MSQYHLDPSRLSLDWLREKIASHEIVPARRILQEKISERFATLRGAGVDTVADLIRALGSRDRIGAFARRTGLPEGYLTWLGREARSYRPNPFALRDIPGVRSDLVAALGRVGIRTTKALFDRAAAPADRRRLAETLGVPTGELACLVELSDLARIRGMGKTFVRLFYESGTRNVAALADCDPEELHARLRAVDRDRNLSSVVPSLKDVAEYVEMARELPVVVVPPG